MESCLLCLEQHSENLNNIKVNSPQWQELDIESVIEKHLWAMHTLQLSSSVLCGNCWEQLYDFHKFYRRIENAHINFGLLMQIEIPETYLTPELIVEEETITNDEYEEDLSSDEISLQQLTKNSEIITNSKEKILKDPLNAVAKLEDANATKDNECSLKQAQPKKSKPSKKPAKQQIKTNTSSNTNTVAKLENANATKDHEYSLKQVQPKKSKSSKKPAKQQIKTEAVVEDYEDNYEDLNSNSDSNNEPVKKKNSNKEKDKFIADNFKLTCELCQIPMATFFELSKHFANHHQNRPYVTCCNKKFTERSYLLNHLKQHLDPNCYKCEDCNKVCPTPESLKIHRQIHDENRKRNYCCDVCGLSFYTATTLDVHKTRHLTEDEKSFSCSKCDKKFGSDYTLKSHIRTIHGVHLVCNFCGLKCVNRFSLAKHIDLKHSENEKEYVCPICSKISYNQRSHQRHIKDAHQTGYVHKCTMCDKAFKRAQKLKEHMSVHTGIPLHKCLWCPQAFKKSSNLSTHRRKYHPKEWEEYVRAKYSGNSSPANKISSTSD